SSSKSADVFFFQAEDGIRDLIVTGVQTCALPISDAGTRGSAVTPAVGEHDGLLIGVLAGGRPRRSAAVRNGLLDALREGRVPDRSEERRVGKEWTPRSAAVAAKQKASHETDGERY